MKHQLLGVVKTDNISPEGAHSLRLVNTQIEQIGHFWSNQILNEFNLYCTSKQLTQNSPR